MSAPEKPPVDAPRELRRLGPLKPLAVASLEQLHETILLHKAELDGVRRQIAELNARGQAIIEVAKASEARMLEAIRQDLEPDAKLPQGAFLDQLAEGGQRFLVVKTA